MLNQGHGSYAYSYDPEGGPGDNALENSPEELRASRKVYQEIVRNALSDNKPLPTSSIADSRWTRRSMVIEDLKITSDNPAYTHGIMGNVFDRMQEILLEQPGKGNARELYLYDIACGLDDGTLDEGILRVLKEGFFFGSLRVWIMLL